MGTLRRTFGEALRPFLIFFSRFPQDSIPSISRMEVQLTADDQFQWRYKPVSDFYLIYTDNYTEEFTIKSRRLSFKLIYWI